MQNLVKLEKAGIVVRKKYSQLHKGLTYFVIVNRKAAELTLKQYLWHVGFQLARYVPMDKITVDELKIDRRFVERATYFGLSVDEGIDVVKKCPHVRTSSGRVRVDFDKTVEVIFLERITQGYIPPEVEEGPEEVG